MTDILAFAREHFTLLDERPEPGEFATSEGLTGRDDAYLELRQASVSEGEGRNVTLARYLGALRRKGLEGRQLWLLAHDWNEKSCVPPMDAPEVDHVVRSILRYPAAAYTDNGECLRSDRHPEITEELCLLQQGAEDPSVVRTDDGQVFFLGDTPDERICLVTARNLCAQRVEQAFVVNHLIPKGGLTVLAAPPRAGKSLLLSYIGKCVIEGTPLFGDPEYFVAEQGPVVGMNVEDDKAVTKPRLERLGLAECDDFYLMDMALSEWDEGLATSRSVQKLRKIIEVIRPRVVWIDPAADALQLPDEDKAPIVSGALRPLRHLAQETGTAIVVIHHTNKAGTVRGSNAWIGSTTLFIAGKDKNEGDADLPPCMQLSLYGKQGSRSLTVVMDDDEGLRWSIDGRLVARSGKEVPEVQVLAFLRNHPGLHPVTEIVDGSQLSTATVYKVLPELLAKGMALTRPGPRGAALYAATGGTDEDIFG